MVRPNVNSATRMGKRRLRGARTAHLYAGTGRRVLFHVFMARAPMTCHGPRGIPLLNYVGVRIKAMACAMGFHCVVMDFHCTDCRGMPYHGNVIAVLWFS